MNYLIFYDALHSFPGLVPYFDNASFKASSVWLQMFNRWHNITKSIVLSLRYQDYPVEQNTSKNLNFFLYIHTKSLFIYCLNMKCVSFAISKISENVVINSQMKNSTVQY